MLGAGVSVLRERFWCEMLTHRGHNLSLSLRANKPQSRWWLLLEGRLRFGNSANASCRQGWKRCTLQCVLVISCAGFAAGG